MSERNLDDVDWAPSAEQSSEDDEAQEGNWLAGEVASSEPAEHAALHIEGGDDEDDDFSDLDEIDNDDNIAIAVRKGDALRDDFNKALSEIRSNGELARLEQANFGQ